MRTDEDLKTDVEEELIWAPDVVQEGINVAVTGGIVALTGQVPTAFDRLQAENAARRIRGVCGVVNDIQITPSAAEVRTDVQIAREALDDIRADLPAVADDIQIIVHEGHVTIDGTVAWQWQRQRIESTVRACKGVVLVTNLISVRPRALAADIRQRIEDAFRRSAELDAHEVSVATRDGEVTLSGAVCSLREKDEAQRTAWSAPGVTRVVNDIVVRP